jgi:hypothetical protein
MLDDANLLRDHIELLADFHAELDKRVAVIRAEPLSLGQLVAELPASGARESRHSVQV